MPFHQTGWQMLRTIFLLLLFSLAAAVSPAQTKDKEYKISARDKAELQRQSKRFVKRMQQTRDVRPLIAEFYLKEFTDFFGDLFMAEMKRSAGPKLSRKQFLDVYSALTNEIYLRELSYMVKKGGNLSDMLPVGLAKAIEDFPNDTKMSAQEYSQKLIRWKNKYQEAKAELNLRNYEGSPQYKATWAERVKEGDYNFIVSSEAPEIYDDVVDNPEEKTVLAKVRRRFPEGIRSFDVTTPVGLELSFVKVHGRFKIIFVWVYPWD
jgi:hypothetical protein